ncbi:hypothetical protein EDC01DRAFT_658450 [Geopyxis carbonaria]|nr:hypothetical protein EDC01DRAFT_658450 [Geopyxis carbonaria]
MLNKLLATTVLTAALSSACIVPQVIFSSLPNEFRLVTQVPSNAALDKQTITFLAPDTAGASPYRAVLAAGETLNMNFTANTLSINEGADTAFLQLPIKTTYRRMALIDSPENSLKLYAKYGCGPDDESSNLQIYPVGGDDGALTFCAVKDAFGGDEFVVAAKPVDDTSKFQSLRWRAKLIHVRSRYRLCSFSCGG